MPGFFSNISSDPILDALRLKAMRQQPITGDNVAQAFDAPIAPQSASPFQGTISQVPQVSAFNQIPYQERAMAAPPQQQQPSIGEFMAQMAAQQPPQQSQQQSPGGFFSQLGMQRQPDELEQALQPGAAQQRYQALQNEGATKHHGFWGRLKDAGIGFLMNGIPGALTGLVAPDVIHNLRYQQELGQQGRLAKEEGAMQNSRFDNLANLRQMREQEAYRRAQLRNLENDNQFNRDQLGFRQKQEQRLIDEQARDNARAEKDKLFQRRDDLDKRGGMPMPTLGDAWFDPAKREEARANPNRGNFIPVTEGERYRMPSQSQQDQRKLAQVTNEERARNVEALKLKIAELPIERQKYADRKRIEESFSSTSDKLDLTGVPTPSQFENAKSSAVSLSQRAQNAWIEAAKAPADKKVEIEDEAKKLQAQADAALGEAWALHSHIIGSGGYEDNSGGGYPGIKRLQRTKKGGVVSGGRRSATSGKAQKVANAADVDDFAKEAFGGDKQKAIEWFKANGYTVK